MNLVCENNKYFYIKINYINIKYKIIKKKILNPYLKYFIIISIINFIKMMY